MQLLSAYLPVALGCLVVLVLASKVQNYLEAQAFAQKNGTQPARKLPQWEQWVGIQNVLEMLRAARNHGILELGLRRYTAMGKTFETKALGRSFTHTIDPENIKTVLSTNFKDFAVGQRIDTLGPLLGSGIFTTDGSAWEHSRVSCCSGLVVYSFGFAFVVLYGPWSGGRLGLPTLALHPACQHLSCTHSVPFSPEKSPLHRPEGPVVVSLSCIWHSPRETDAILLHSFRPCRIDVRPRRQKERRRSDWTRGEIENCPFGISSFPDWPLKAYTPAPPPLPPPFSHLTHIQSAPPKNGNLMATANMSPRHL